MTNILNSIAMTLLVAVLAVFPATVIGSHMPGFFNPTLKPIALAAWMSGLGSWWLAWHVFRKQQQEREESHRRSPGPVMVTAAFVAAALCVLVVLHFFGDSLL
jgi:undecaprenyl pyrophosphate phosphatase UppP